jgi:hypothetical protein
MTARRFTVPFVLALAALAPPARAQRPARPPVALADVLTGAAKDAYNAGKLLLVNSDFQGALTKFQQAYDLSKDPRLLYNMAICQKNLHAYARMQKLLLQYERDAGAAMAPDQRVLVDSALAAIAGLVGAVQITLVPAGASDGATVQVDGEPAGTTPLRDAIIVDLGKHTIRVQKDGFDPLERTVDISGGGATQVSLTLAATVHDADLTVAAEDGATVSIDERVVGSGQYHAKVPAGPHAVRVTEPGRLPFSTELVLRDAETRTLEVTLREDRHALIWPWVVGGVVVAAGAVVGGYFLFQPSNTTTPVPPGKLGVGSVQLSSLRLR